MAVNKFFDEAVQYFLSEIITMVKWYKSSTLKMARSTLGFGQLWILIYSSACIQTLYDNRLMLIKFELIKLIKPYF